MTPPATEIAIWPTSEAYRASTDVLNDGFLALSSVDGLQKTFHGLQVENPETGYAFNIWDTVEHHIALINSDAFAPLIQKMLPAFIGPINVLHVHFSPPEVKALYEPVTEVTILKFKSTDSRDNALSALAELSANSAGMLSYGKTVEEENTLVIVRGGPGIPAQPNDVVESLPALTALHPLADTVDVKRVTLTQYQK